MLSFGSYLLGAAQLVVLLGASRRSAAYRLRARLLPGWRGAPARLVETIVAIGLLIWLSELLGTFGLFYAGRPRRRRRPCWRGSSPGCAGGGGGTGAPRSAAGGAVSGPLREAAPTAAGGRGPRRAGRLVPRRDGGVIAIVVFHWAMTTKHALDRGIFNFDSLWYHMPFSADMAQCHSVTGMHHVETVFTNWFYPQNSELLHAVGILLTGRDTLSPVHQLRLARRSPSSPPGASAGPTGAGP